MRRLYVLFDLVAEAITGQVQSFPGDAAAIRAFGDVMSNPETMLSKHPQDFELRCIAQLSDAGELEALPSAVVISGAQWVAAQQGPKLAKEA